MTDWKKILQDIYSPEVGSILAAQNGIWKNSFASNKSERDYHPALLGKLSSCNTYCRILPGTSKDYRKGTCVFKVKLNKTESNWPISHFLIDLWMTINVNELITIKKGWNGIENLDDNQLREFKQQIKHCKGIDV